MICPVIKSASQSVETLARYASSPLVSLHSFDADLLDPLFSQGQIEAVREAGGALVLLSLLLFPSTRLRSDPFRSPLLQPTTASPSLTLFVSLDQNVLVPSSSPAHIPPFFSFFLPLPAALCTKIRELVAAQPDPPPERRPTLRNGSMSVGSSGSAIIPESETSLRATGSGGFSNASTRSSS